MLACFFVASEYRAWMQFYALPVLKDILPATYHKHLALLVCAMHILLGESISSSSLAQAKTLLDRFYVQYEQLYGRSYSNFFT